MSEVSNWFGAVAAAYARHRITYPAGFYDAFLARPWCGIAAAAAARPRWI